MRHLTLLLCVACSSSSKPGADAVPVDTSVDPVDSGTADADPPETGTPDDAEPPTTPPETGSPPTLLQPGFEADLTDLRGCIGTLWALNADATIALSFYANDLAGAAFIAGQDATHALDLAVEGSRLEVRVGSDLDADICGSTGTATVDAVYGAVSGAAVLDVWPHANQAEQTEGALFLSNVGLEAPGFAPVTLVSLELPRMSFSAL